MRDGVDVCHVPAFSITVEADMSDLRWAIQTARTAGFRLTYAHVMVRAAALVLARNPDLHGVVCGSKISNPADIDIALSISGDTAVAPLMIIAGAQQKSATDIAREVIDRAPAVREADRALMKTLDRWGRLVPLAFLRRTLLRLLFRSPRFRRNGCGSFQVTMLSTVDQASSMVFSSAAVLLVGRVREKPVVYGGNLAVRAMVTLTCCADHRIWDGQAGQRFLTSIREILESDLLPNEIRAGLGL
jgi:pyruvate dehydrogenase E2 component (dihydrolipoamide acetyltransferase)